MSILIEGMDIPKDGMVGVFISSDRNVYDSMDDIIGTTVPVPPHGRLIDADSAMECIKSCRAFKGDFIIILEDIFDGEPTIIEAEG